MSLEIHDIMGWARHHTPAQSKGQAEPDLWLCKASQHNSACM